MAGKASAGLIAALLVFTMLLIPSTVTAYPENPGEGITIECPVIFHTDNVNTTLWSEYDPYYIEVTNDTITLATVAGEFSMQFWANDDIEFNITTFEPYGETLLEGLLVGSGTEDLKFHFGGLQPSAVYGHQIDGSLSSTTVNETGWLNLNINNIDANCPIRIFLNWSPPVFTTSPDISAQAMIWYYYDAGAYPSDAVITVVTLPYWLYWNEDNTDMIGLPRDLGSFPVSLKATNEKGTIYQNWTITIYPQDLGFMSNPDLTVTKFDSYFYLVDYYPENADLKCLVNPTWLHLNEHTNTLEGYANKAGTFNVVLRITLGPMVAYQNFTITVNDVVGPPSWLDTPSTMDMDHAMFYILLGVGVAFILLVFYMRRKL